MTPERVEFVLCVDFSDWVAWSAFGALIEFAAGASSFEVL